MSISWVTGCQGVRGSGGTAGYAVSPSHSCLSSCHPDTLSPSLGASAFRLLQRGEVTRQLVARGCLFDGVVIEVVAGRYPIVAQHVGGLEILGELADVEGGLEEGVPRFVAVPAPTFTRGPVAAEDLGQLPHRLDR